MANGNIVLGTAPGPLQVNLTTGADFICTLRLDTDWPVGTAVKLVFKTNPETEWSATVSGTDATFTVDKATADTIRDSLAVRLTYVNGTTDQTWAIGKVKRHG